MRVTNFLIAGAALSLLACSRTPDTRVASARAACGQLPDAKAAAARFYQPGAVLDAKPVERKFFKARAIQPTRVVGAQMTVRAEKGMTSEYVQRVLACHVASGTPAHPNDPLHPSQGRVAELSVRSAGSALAVRVVGDSVAAGREILHRAQSLAADTGNVSVEQVAQAASPTTTF